MKLTRLFPVFSVAFVILYVIVLYNNLALFTYEPATGKWGWLVVTPKAGPPMYWYGWLATTTIGALIVSAIAALLPAQWATRIWSGWAWVVPTVALATIAFILRAYFIH